MQRPIISFQQVYEYVRVDLEALLTIEAAVKSNLLAEIKAVQIRRMPHSKLKFEYLSTWKEFEKVWRRDSEQIRKYSVIFSKEALTHPIQMTCVELTVRLQGHHGQTDAKEIVLNGKNCYDSDFMRFCGICEGQLGLKKKPQLGFDPEFERLKMRVAAIVETPALMGCIDGSLRVKDYDGILRAAVVLVEDELRKKCLSIGDNRASGQTGVDLAATAFHGTNGCLNPPWPIATQAAEGAHLMFRGFFMYLRNAWGHNAQVFGHDESVVAEFVAFAQFLLAVIRLSTKR